MQLSFAQQIWPWGCLDLPQRLAIELGPSIMHDFTILSYPPFLDYEQMTKKIRNLYMNIKNKMSHPPWFLLIFWDIVHFAHFGDIDSFWHPKWVKTRIIWSSFLITTWFNLIILPWVQVHSLVPILNVWNVRGHWNHVWNASASEYEWNERRNRCGMWLLLRKR